MLQPQFALAGQRRGVELDLAFRATSALTARVIATLSQNRIDAYTDDATGVTYTDVEPLLDAGVPVAGLHVDDTRYFWYHHTNADTPDKLDPRDVARCVAVFAVYAYVVAEMPEVLPRGR